MLTNEILIERLEKNFDKDILAFVQNVNTSLNPFDVYGLNISIYLNRSEANSGGKSLYDIYSFDYSEEPEYYNKIWEGYLAKYKLFSNFNADLDIQRGWYDSSKPFPKENKTKTSKTFSSLMAVKEKLIHKETPRPCKIEYSQKIHPQDFIHVTQGWEKFVDEIEEKKFNLSWVASFIHMPISEEFEYRHWYISCYLLLNIGESINIKPGDKKNYKSSIRPNINKLLFNTSLSLHEILIEEKQKDLARQATKAAISQVMARNMSHNIGSHVLSKLVTAQSLSETAINNYTPLENVNNDLEDNSYLSLAYLNSYLKTRMDFLADIATSTPSLESSKSLFNDLLAGLDRNRLLLNNISGVSDFKFSICALDCRANSKKRLTVNDDIKLAIPNDILGNHALYVIIENIIRNTAKHGNGGAERKHEFTLKIELGNADTYKITIFDDIELSNAEIKDFSIEELDDKELCKLFPQFKIGKLDELVYSQNINLNRSILDSKSNSLRQGAWGLVEMDVSAAYLRKIPIEEVDTNEYSLNPYEHFLNCDKSGNKIGKLPILKAVKVEERYFGYEFYILKPKNYLVLCNDDVTINDQVRLNAEEVGIYFVFNTEFENSIEHSIYPHQMLVNCTNKDMDNFFKRNSGAIPYRRITLDSPCLFLIDNIFTMEDIVNIDEECWNIWLKQRMEKLNVSAIKVGKDETVNSFTIPNNLANTENLKTFTAILSPHGESWSTDKLKFLGEQKKCQFVEPISSRSKTLLPNYVGVDLKYLFGLETPRKLKLAEGLSYSICVIDERIQEAAKKLKYFPEKNPQKQNPPEPIPFEEIYKCTNILIPDDKLIDLNSIDFLATSVDKPKNIKENMEGYFKNLPNNLDYLVIHLGIIEKLLKGESKDDIGIENFINNQIKAHNPSTEIIVISGRGKPHNLPQRQKFLNYSVVSDCLIEDRSVYKFINNLISARQLKTK